ncbi:MAG: DUF2059 domain-containing protein [Myxococcales bacterium]|nr:DUF2059 domain-containing protein [Myxococcales bacterium]
MRRGSIVFLVLWIAGTAGIAGMAGAAEPEPDASARRELARAVLRANGGGDMAQQLAQVMIESSRENYASTVQQLISSQPNLSEAEQLAIAQRLSNYDHFAGRYYERMLSEVDFEGILDAVYTPLYMKFFTEQELRELLAFQSSPVGQKAAALTPQLMQEGMRATIPLLQPKLISIAEQILLEEQAIALSQLEAPEAGERRDDAP